MKKIPLFYISTQQTMYFYQKNYFEKYYSNLGLTRYFDFRNIKIDNPIDQKDYRIKLKGFLKIIEIIEQEEIKEFVFFDLDTFVLKKTNLENFYRYFNSYDNIFIDQIQEKDFYSCTIFKIQSSLFKQFKKDFEERINGSEIFHGWDEYYCKNFFVKNNIKIKNLNDDFIIHYTDKFLLPGKSAFYKKQNILYIKDK